MILNDTMKSGNTDIESQKSVNNLSEITTWEGRLLQIWNNYPHTVKIANCVLSCILLVGWITGAVLYNKNIYGESSEAEKKSLAGIILLTTCLPLFCLHVSLVQAIVWKRAFESN